MAKMSIMVIGNGPDREIEIGGKTKEQVKGEVLANVIDESWKKVAEQRSTWEAEAKESKEAKLKA